MYCQVVFWVDPMWEWLGSTQAEFRGCSDSLGKSEEDVLVDGWRPHKPAIGRTPIFMVPSPSPQLPSCGPCDCLWVHLCFCLCLLHSSRNDLWKIHTSKPGEVTLCGEINWQHGLSQALLSHSRTASRLMFCKQRCCWPWQHWACVPTWPRATFVCLRVSVVF